jgi:hypothetical protein
MKEHPAIFSSEMVRAILEDRKTMTRRVCKDQTPNRYFYAENIMTHPYGKVYFGWAKNISGLPFFLPTKCPYGQVGDRLWVKETYHSGNQGIIYRESYGNDGCPEFIPKKWKPSIYMPRWASRITLEITNIRVERLQEITNKDLIKEGYPIKDDLYVEYGKYENAKEWFITLWDSINGKKYPWESNSWVWCLEFKKI